ncbi:MAG: ribonuclease J [Oscillospiraceae bacterium]|nr:ribonuclease J [Oscillospiraceae bacterium]
MQNKVGLAGEKVNGKKAAHGERKNRQVSSKKTPSKKTGSKKKSQGNPVKIAFLGGLNEVGKNITLYEYNNEMILVDCGMAFPDQDMPGVDIVLPDFTYIERNASKISGIFITHGHEDHIGGLAYLLKVVNLPVYATRLTIGLIEAKLKEHGLVGKVKLNVVSPGDHIKTNEFDIEMIHVNHSIPDALAFAIKCGAGTIVQTGDFKVDTTPIDGEMIDLARFAQIGEQGVLCLLSDSTNAERPGYAESEKKVGESFDLLFKKAGNRRIIVATFASNIHRVQQIIDAAKALGRKVALSGRSLENVVAIGTQLGYLNVPENLLIPIDMISRHTPSQLVLITTGSQGEPLSALSRMAFSDHRKVAVGAEDYVIISATPIPGNEKMVSKVVNELMRLGAEVVYEKMYDVHVSGHACQEELKLMLGLVKPKYFIPVHGEQKHIRKHAALAEGFGISKKNIVVAENGVKVELTKNSLKLSGSVPSGRVFVDGSGVGDVGSIVLRDRKHLAQDGLIIIVATIDSASGEIVAGPDVVSRGFVYVRESEELIEDAKRIAQKTLDICISDNIKDWGSIKSKLRDEISHLLYDRTKRSPMILPIIMEV